MCLHPGGDACVLGVVERAGNALYGARVYVELGRRLAHAHAAHQGRPDSLSQLVRDRRPAKSLTFTLGGGRADAAVRRGVCGRRLDVAVCSCPILSLTEHEDRDKKKCP